jgi:hypothetical protein
VTHPRHAKILTSIVASSIPGHKEVITYDQVLHALAKNKGEPKDQVDAYIRDSFDWFFFRTAQLWPAIPNR